jgi:hypothetical protein
MAMLKLNYADGRRLVIPAQTVKAIRGASPKLLEAFPDARSTIFYVMCGQVRSAGLVETFSTVKSMLDKDKTVEVEWLEVEDHLALPFCLQVPDIRAATGIDPEAPLPNEPESHGCTVKIDLEFSPGVAYPVYAHADMDDIIDALEPPSARRRPAPAAVPKPRRTAK